jgi:hypothetical protein
MGSAGEVERAASKTVVRFSGDRKFRIPLSADMISYGTHRRTAGRLITETIDYGQFVCIVQISVQIILDVIWYIHVWFALDSR